MAGKHSGNALWIVTMDRKVRKDILRRYADMTASVAAGESNIGQINCYFCPQCERITKTVVKDSGIVPMGIECPYCHAEALCSENGDVAEKISVTHNWYRPTAEETLELAQENKLFTVSMILSGGLLREKL